MGEPVTRVVTAFREQKGSLLRIKKGFGVDD
jgi:hypothetical protein